MGVGAQQEIERSKKKLLDAIAGAQDITFLRAWGNIGDQLIYAGTRQLLSAVRYSEVSIRDLKGCGGQTALISGSGGWCGAYHDMPLYLQMVEQRFAQVIVLPSSFDTSVEAVRRTLSRTKALVFAREEASFDQIRNLCNAQLAHDGAFFFDFRPYQCRGKGTLISFRTDREACGRRIPPENNDISLTCDSLDAWLWTIARHERVLTDRAHVMIGAAMLGKEVHYGISNYHKVPAIVKFALGGFPVYPIDKPSEPADEGPSQAAWTTSLATSRKQWREDVERSVQDLSGIIPPGGTFILVDQDQFGQLPLSNRRSIPFVERQGQYWGPPADNQAAIHEVERLRQAGAGWMAFAWPAFWWLEYYSGFRRYLETNFHCRFKNDRLVVFDLHPPRLPSRAYRAAGEPIRTSSSGYE